MIRNAYFIMESSKEFNAYSHLSLSSVCFFACQSAAELSSSLPHTVFSYTN